MPRGSNAHPGPSVNAPGMAMAGMASANAGIASAMLFSFATFTATLTMWWVMMVAMMLPSAAPMILLYARAAAGHSSRFEPASASFLAGYLLAWGAFSLGAAILNVMLDHFSVLTPMTLALNHRLLSSAFRSLPVFISGAQSKTLASASARVPPGSSPRTSRRAESVPCAWACCTGLSASAAVG
jgi:predicted metal-binding membrane protein